MDEYESLSHSKWECKYHIVFIPNVAGRCFTEICDSIWARCSGSWLTRRSAALKKVIVSPAMCTL